MRSPRPLIDSHAHLDFDRFAEDLDAVLDRAADANVPRAITIGTDLASSRRAVELAGRFPGRLWASAGVHPHQADAFQATDWPPLQALWATAAVVAVGETGLDYFYNYGDRVRQRSLFERHVAESNAVGKPVVVHIRDAFEDAFRILEAGGVQKGVVHCFTGGPAECERALALGLYISLSGIVTFKSATALREAATLVPADRLLVETDSPFLAPVPHRGKRNEPAFVTHVAACVAELRGEPLDALCDATRANTERLFALNPAAH